MTVAIPAELRARDQWVVWRFETRDRDGKRTKVPYAVRTGARASVTDPASWASFDDAQAFAERHAYGVGFVFTGDDPFVGVDLDDCIVDGELHPDAERIVRALSSYAEVSPSKTGIKIFAQAKLNCGRRRTGSTPWSGEFEVYDQGRFFTVTGEVLEGAPHEVAERQRQLDELVAQLLPAAATGMPSAGAPSGRTDAEVVERAFAAKNGDAIRALYAGDGSGYGSDSEADLALLSMLAFWTGPDPDQLDRLFRGSGLMRAKWERPDYRERTTSKALGTAEFYDWEKVTRSSESPESPLVSRGVAGLADSGDSPYRSHRVSQDTPKAPVGDSDGAESSESPPFGRPLRDFLDEVSDSPAALVGDDDEVLLPAGGLLMLVARGGKGKTTLTIDFAFHLVSGVDWLGFKVARPLRVLLVENEGPREPFRAKLATKTKVWPHELAGELFVHTLDWGGFTLADGDARAQLRSYIESNEIDVVVGDPLDSLGVAGVGSPEDVRAFMALMHEVGLHKDVAFVLLHHPHKGESADPLDEASGAWGGKPDTQLNLDKKTNNRARLSFPKVRWSRRGTRSAYLLAFDPDTESFSVVHEEADEERDYDAEIVALLTQTPWRTPKEIAASADKGGIGANVDLVKDRLTKRHDLFVPRKGDDAKAVGRHPSATVWSLRDVVNEPQQKDLRWE